MADSQLWSPIAYFSRKLQPAETKYSTFDREFPAIYLAIFRHFVEGRTFHVITDHKPLTFVFSIQTKQHSSRQIQHLDFISQLTTDIRHIKGVDNTAADALSRLELDASHEAGVPAIDLRAMAKAQSEDTALHNRETSSSRRFPVLQQMLL